MNRYEIGDFVHFEEVNSGLEAAYGVVSHIVNAYGRDPVLYVRVLAFDPKNGDLSRLQILPPSKLHLGDVCVRQSHIINYRPGYEPQYAYEKLPTNLIEGKYAENSQ